MRYSPRVAFGAALIFAVPAALHAQPLPAPLDKPAVEALIVGHKLTFVRATDGNKVSWTIDKNGVLYGENYTRDSKDTARWTLNDKGELCLKWRGNSTDGCRVFGIVDGKTLMFDANTPGVVNATLEKID